MICGCGGCVFLVRFTVTLYVYDTMGCFGSVSSNVGWRRRGGMDRRREFSLLPARFSLSSIAPSGVSGDILGLGISFRLSQWPRLRY